MSRTPVTLSDDLVTALREHFSEVPIVELTHLIALENLHGRFNFARGISLAGFSEGRVWALPAFDRDETPRGVSGWPPPPRPFRSLVVAVG